MGQESGVFQKIINFFNQLDKPVQIIVLVASIGVAIWLFFRYEKLQRELSIKKLETDTEIADVQLSKSKATRFKVDSKVEIWKLSEDEDGFDIFEVNLLIEVTNISDKSFSMPSHLIKNYLGTVNWTDLVDKTIVRMNLPDDKIIKPSGVVRWQINECEFYRESEDINEPPKNNCASLNILTSDMTIGRIDPGEPIQIAHSFLIRAKRDQYIAFRIELDVMENDQEPYKWPITEWSYLSGSEQIQ